VLDEFWTGIGGKLADRWMALVFSPAFAFWTGGLAAWVWRYRRPEIERDGWQAALERWASVLQGLPVVAQGALVFGLLAGVLVSGLIVQRLSMPVLRLLEGYWPRWLWWLRDRLTRRHSDRAKADAERLRELLGRDQQRLTAREAADLVRLDRRRHGIPADVNRRMPTRLGNILRAAEGRPRAFHGLEAVVSWPRLWLLLPDAAKQEMTQARASLDAAAQLWLWGVLFVAWTIWAWWALPLGLLVATVAYFFRMLPAASVYGDLLESCFDVHRWLLYKSLRWPLPTSPADEQRRGTEVTVYLWRGSRSPVPVFAVEEGGMAAAVETEAAGPPARPAFLAGVVAALQRILRADSPR
jgi:hypothetical protein